MRRDVASVLVVAALLGVAAEVGRSAPAAPTPAQVVAGFARQTGATLASDRRASYPGHYTALGLPPSISTIGRFGRFTVWVVTSGNEADVISLLADAHTGRLGTPGRSRIYWERATSMGGDAYWLAKKRYGATVVLWWYGSRQRIDATFSRLHRALAAVAAPA
jgi:hypothetical protein